MWIVGGHHSCSKARPLDAPACALDVSFVGCPAHLRHGGDVVQPCQLARPCEPPAVQAGVICSARICAKSIDPGHRQCAVHLRCGGVVEWARPHGKAFRATCCAGWSYLVGYACCLDTRHGYDAVHQLADVCNVCGALMVCGMVGHLRGLVCCQVGCLAEGGLRLT